MTSTNLMDSYLSYIGETESPITFHRWSYLSILGAWLGRRYFFQHGHFIINPNIYCMLMGSPGTRKSTAIKVAAKLIKQAGYLQIAAERTTKEKFLMDLAGEVSEYDGAASADDILDQNLFGDATPPDAEILIAADEFNTFVGNGNIEFLSLLGVLWDYDGKFEDKKKNSKSLVITNPTVSLLAGNTPTGFSLAFPIEAIGQGIFSRLILVHGESTGKKITFPTPPDLKETAQLIELFQAVKSVSIGKATLTHSAELLLDKIYKHTAPLPDVRFESYSTRRFTQLLKLCLLVSASSFRREITEQDVVYANTILSHTEHTMPKALGEFGKAKNSDVAHKIIQILEASFQVVTVKQIWKQLHNDLNSLKDLTDMMAALTYADKIISTKGGFLAKRNVLEEVEGMAGVLDYSLLTAEERKYVS